LPEHIASLLPLPDFKNCLPAQKRAGHNVRALYRLARILDARQQPYRGAPADFFPILLNRG
jgi:hypothetical protein